MYYRVRPCGEGDTCPSGPPCIRTRLRYCGYLITTMKCFMHICKSNSVTRLIEAQKNFAPFLIKADKSVRFFSDGSPRSDKNFGLVPFKRKPGKKIFCAFGVVTFPTPRVEKPRYPFIYIIWLVWKLPGVNE